MTNPDRANALIEQANALQKSGDKLEAAPLYLEAASLFPPYGTFALVAGDTYAAAGRDSDAIAAYRACLGSAPDHEQALEGLGQCLLRSGDEAGARDAFAKAGLPFPGDKKPGLLKRWFGIGS